MAAQPCRPSALTNILFYDGTIFVPVFQQSQPPKASALDGRTGAILASEPAQPSAFRKGQGLYVDTSNNLTAFDLHRFAQDWSTPLGAAAVTQPLIVNNYAMVVTGTFASGYTLHVLSMLDGTQPQTAALPSGAVDDAIQVAGLAANNGLVFVGINSVLTAFVGQR